jgi:hypothetical protein
LGIAAGDRVAVVVDRDADVIKVVIDRLNQQKYVM